jgi:hypothetical protein
VEGEQRALDRAGQHDGPEHEQLRAAVQAQPVQRVEIEGPLPRLLQALRAQHDHRGQEQHAAGHRVEEEGHRRAAPLRAAKDQDQQHHRDQHRLPQHEEDHQVLRQEGAQQRRLQGQQQAQVELAAGFGGGPGAGQHDRKQQRGQQQQIEIEPVDRKVQAHAQRRHPGQVDGEAARGRLAIEADHDKDCPGQQRQHHRHRQYTRQSRA